MPINPDVVRMDIEATQFAMELLMPEDWLCADIKAHGVVDVERDPSAIKWLAKRYNVSEQLMTVRLGQIFGGDK